MTEPKKTDKIHKAILAIMEEVGAIGKDGYNESQGFKFRSIEAVCNAIHGLLVKHGVYFTPEVIGEPIVHTGTNAKGNNWFHVVMKVRYTFRVDDGSFVVLEVPAEAADYQDKACNKAMSMAEKIALCQLFCIPTADANADPDADSPDLDTNGQGPAAATAQEALDNKGDKRASRQGKMPPGTKAFRDAADELAKRDLKDWKLSEADYKQIGQEVVSISGVKGAKAAGAWLKEHGRLELIQLAHGEVGGIIVHPAEAATV